MCGKCPEFQEPSDMQLADDPENIWVRDYFVPCQICASPHCMSAMNIPIIGLLHIYGKGKSLDIHWGPIDHGTDSPQ